MRGPIPITLALALCLRPAWSQRPVQSDSLPRELVVALMGGGMGPDARPDVIPNVADSSLPAALFAGATVLGHAAYPRSRTTVAYFPFGSTATTDTIRARLLRFGWREPPRAAVTERGFVGSYGSMFQNVLCGDRSVIVPAISVRDSSRTLAIISNQATSRADDPRCGGEGAGAWP